MLSGWINVCKPVGVTSNYVTSFFKRLCKPYKVGHVGTLDPLASGVLVLAIGQATKLVEYAVQDMKCYDFTVQFGQQTSTGDAEGQVIATSDFMPTVTQINAAIPHFLGEIEQKPSAYSAIKINGVCAYKLARNGKEVNIPSRKVDIYELKLIDYDEYTGRASFRCKCSSGTYVRNLAEDISLYLQTVGFVVRLHRVCVGNFIDDISNARELIDWNAYKNVFSSVDFSQIDRDKSKEIKALCIGSYQVSLEQILLPLDTVLDDILVVSVNEEIAKKIRCGVQTKITDDISDSFVSVKANGNLIAVGNLHNGTFVSTKVFNN